MVLHEYALYSNFVDEVAADVGDQDTLITTLCLVIVCLEAHCFSFMVPPGLVQSD